MTTPATSRTPDYALELEKAINAANAWLTTLDEPVVSWRPHATAWSAKEIIGHLIDSAANNHVRFVNSGIEDTLVFGGYRQDEWVRAQSYASAPWVETVALWTAYNAHLARVMAAIPADVRERQHTTHNLHQIGWRPFSPNDPATLDDLMRDYVGHLEHHLDQVRERVRATGGTTE